MKLTLHASLTIIISRAGPTVDCPCCPDGLRKAAATNPSSTPRDLGMNISSLLLEVLGSLEHEVLLDPLAALLSRPNCLLEVDLPANYLANHDGL